MLLLEDNFNSYDNWYISSQCKIVLTCVYATKVIVEILLALVTEVHCTVSRTSSFPGPDCSLSAVTRDKVPVSEKNLFTLKHL
jgi:hypothetical protein